jgi:hypothetical protein
VPFSLENTKFYLDFEVGVNTGSFQRKEIAEPTLFDSVQFKLKQDSGRYGRDVMFTDSEFEFNPLVEIRGLTHEFDLIMQQFKFRGFEANIRFVLEVSGVEYVLGQLDFATAETDGLKYLKCKVIQDTLQMILKRRSDVKVNLLSDETVDGSPITPLQTEPILLQTLPLLQTSTWELPGAITYLGGDPARFYNPALQITKSQIQNTLSPSSFVVQTSDNDSEFLQDYAIIEAVNTLTDGTLKIRNGAWTNNNNIGFGIYVRKGIDIATSETLFSDNSFPFTNNNETDYEATVENISLKRGEKLFVYFAFQGLGGSSVNFTSLDIEADFLSLAVASITDGIPLVDAFNYVVKSISGADTDDTRLVSDFSDQYIFKGTGIRQIKDAPFEISFDDLLKWFPECNLDYQIQPNGTVFIGTEDDFYTNFESGNLASIPNQTYKEYFNPRLSVNTLSYKYDKFEKGENDLQANALDGFHTELEWLFENRRVENKKDIKIGFIRDAYLLEKIRKENILVSENAPTLNDEDVFVLDTVFKDFFAFTESFLLNHSFTDSDTKLELFNDNSFNFELLGFEIGMNVGVSVPFIGLLEVTEINPTSMKFDVVTADSTNNGIFITTMGWTIENIRTNRTNEGFNMIQNASSPNGFANMKYSPRRNLIKYYGKQLRSISTYYPAGVLKNTFLKNNSPVFLSFSEGGEFYSGKQNAEVLLNLLPPARLTPYLVETEVICDWAQFWETIISVREDNGFVTVQDNNNQDVKIYPTSMMYNWEKFLLTLTGEKKGID